MSALLPRNSSSAVARRDLAVATRRRWFGHRVLFAALTAAPIVAIAATPGVRVLDIAPAWSGHPVNFALLTRDSTQFVGFYDADRQMTVAQRKVGSTSWQFVRLPTHVAWDSHNAIMLGLDRDGFLHVAGNMHGIPLVYFRATRPLDAGSLERVTAMTGEAENRVTYPVFFHGPKGELVFTYRNGGAGRGDTYYNVYDEKGRTWRRLINQPLLFGGTEMNAYPTTPFRGPDGLYHLSWVWRNGGGANQNHDLSYARSKDLIHWETAEGRALELPITLRSPGVIVDPVPVNGGIINSSGRVGFDTSQRVVITYHKFDPAGHTQLYFARFENGAWRHYQGSSWEHRWALDTPVGGSIIFEIRHGSVYARDGQLFVPVYHVKYGTGIWEVDSKTMRLAAQPARGNGLPAELVRPRSTFPGMEVRWAEDLQGGPNAPRFLPALSDAVKGTVSLIRWETLDFHGDKPRPKPWPDPQMLQLVEIDESTLVSPKAPPAPARPAGNR